MKIKLIAIALLSITAAAVAYYPNGSQSVVLNPTPPVNPPANPDWNPLAKPRIEVVFVLDTTGSMGGLIDAAKEKIWSIATTMASAQPAPELRMGLVAYRDRGDDYITRVTDLSDDLDTVYATLMDFEAAGGGDGPESVNAALAGAVNQISWSQESGAYQVIFLVGDAPPHRDYPDEAQYPQVLAEAARRGIVVNTIRCGNNLATENEWRQIAALTQGTYFTVEQGGSAVAIATPFDAEIAELSKGLDATRLYYGDPEAKEKAAKKVSATDKLHALASEAARARRAVFNALESGAENLFGDGDLVTDLEAGLVDLSEINPADLPMSMQAMAPEERETYIEDQVAERQALQSKIEALAGRRDAYLAEQAEEVDDVAGSLDYQLFETVRDQAGKKGLAYDETPKL